MDTTQEEAIVHYTHNIMVDFTDTTITLTHIQHIKVMSQAKPIQTLENRLFWKL